MRCCAWIQLIVITGLAGVAGWAHLSTFDKRSIINSTIARHVAAAAAAARNHAAPQPGGEPVDNGAPNSAPAGDQPQDEATDRSSSDDAGTGSPESAATEGASGNTELEPAPPQPPGEVDLDSLPDEISLADARAIYTAGLADFVDARNHDEYEAGHVLGAFNIPPLDIQGVVPRVIQEGILIPGERAIVVYCTGGECDASHLVRDHLRHMGFEQRIFIMTDGFLAWSDAGYDVATGPDEFADGGG